MINVGGSLEGVCTGLGDGVHTTADEVGLTYMVRGNQDLEFLDCVKGDRISSTWKTIVETEVVVEVRTVDSEVGGTSVSSCEAHSISTVRGEPGDIFNAPAYCRESGHLGIGNVGGSTCLLAAELGFRSADDNDFLEEFIGLLEDGVELVGVCELNCHVLVDNACITHG